MQASQWTSGSGLIYYNGGSVGIGTTAPIGTFDVKEATNQHINFVPNTNGAFSEQPGIMSINDANSGYQPMGIYATTLALLGGNVDIGTTSPAQKLDVAGNIQASGAYMISGSSLAQFQTSLANYYLAARKHGGNRFV